MENIRRITDNELKEFILNNNEKAFRAKQISQWIWEKNISNFDQMLNIPKSIISKLKQNFDISKSLIEDVNIDKDNTSKVALKLSDGEIVESVYIPSRNRTTACVSSQSGCKLNCAFCATAKLKNGRNLYADEIYDQVTAIKNITEEHGRNFTNIVYMGMGEPLLNYDEVLKSIARVTGTPGLAMSASRITLSTAGIIPGIIRLADDNIKFNLAISLHSAIDETRSKLMPINNKYPLSELSEAIKYFHDKTGQRITFEYLMLKNVNDTNKHAQALTQYCKSFPVKINLIEYNPVNEYDFQPSDNFASQKFITYLEKHNLVVNIRKSKGKDINAACGQLATSNFNIKK